MILRYICWWFLFTLKFFVIKFVTFLNMICPLEKHGQLTVHVSRCKHRSRFLILGLLAWYGATRHLYTHGREMFWNVTKSSMVLHRYGIWSMIISTCSMTFTVPAHQHLHVVHCSYDIYRLRVTFIIFLYIFSFHPTVKVNGQCYISGASLARTSHLFISPQDGAIFTCTYFSRPNFPALAATYIYTIYLDNLPLTLKQEVGTTLKIN